MAFKRLDAEDFILSADSITAPLWSGYAPKLTIFFTSSAQEASTTGLYYLSIYQTGSAASGTETTNISGSEVQFDIAYGNLKGSGSVPYNSQIIKNTPTSTIYGQYRSLVLGDATETFTFGNVTASDFWAISISRNRYKESLLPGALILKLSGSLGPITLTDDSLTTTTTTFLDSGRVYNLISGSAGVANVTKTSNGWTTSSGSYGWFLPDIGTILLNPLAVGTTLAGGGAGLIPSRSLNGNAYNNRILYNAISASTADDFTLNSQETVTSDYVFIRARNAEFNYSENPSFISGSTGAVLYNSFINNPQTFFTTVGMYNDNNELLAVAKLSKPLIKDFTKEALIRVKLDF